MNMKTEKGMNKNKAGVWPEGIRCAVMFSFDVDGETLWTSRNPENWRRPGNLAQGAYGPRVGVPKILDVLDRHQVKSSFFIPGWIIEKYPHMAKDIQSRGHEIGYHGYLHEFDINAGYEKEKEIMDHTLEVFHRILKTRPVGYRSPLYEVTESTLQIMDEYQFSYSSMMMDDDFPHFWQRENKIIKIVELPTQWMWEDASFFFFTLSEPVRRGISSCKQVFDIWIEEFDEIYKHGAFLNLIFHPQVIGRFSRVKLIDDLLSYMENKKGTWIARGEDIARFWLEEYGTKDVHGADSTKRG